MLVAKVMAAFYSHRITALCLNSRLGGGHSNSIVYLKTPVMCSLFKKCPMLHARLSSHYNIILAFCLSLGGTSTT